LNLSIEYHGNKIPATARQSVTPNGATVMEVAISDNRELGVSASVSIRFGADRAGFIGTLYRHDPATSSLTVVNRATVGNNGDLAFNNITHGGDFLIVFT
jgi:hypothetical protein